MFPLAILYAGHLVLERL